MTWIGVNTFQKFQLRQQTQWVFFGAIWPLHIGTLRKLNTKHWFVYAVPIWHPYHESQIGQVEKVQRTAARWTCGRWRNTNSVGDILDELEWPSLETRREQSSLTFFYKIHLGTVSLDKDKYLIPVPILDELEWPSLETRREQSSLTFFYKIHFGTVSLDKDKYLTPVPNLRRTRTSHESPYTRYFAYSDALKNSFSPRTIPKWNSLPSSVVSSKTIEEFKAQI